MRLCIFFFLQKNIQDARKKLREKDKKKIPFVTYIISCEIFQNLLLPKQRCHSQFKNHNDKASDNGDCVDIAAGGQFLGC